MTRTDALRRALACELAGYLDGGPIAPAKAQRFRRRVVQVARLQRRDAADVLVDLARAAKALLQEATR